MGLVQNSGEQIYRAHRELYKLGRNALPAIEEQILGQSWRDIRHGSQLNLLSGLLSLVNDIDEDRAKRVGEEIRKTGCSSIVKKRITSITTFALNEFRAYEIEGTRIFQSRALGNSPHIKSYMEKWLAIVPKKDMAQIERIYIIPETTEEHRGTYMYANTMQHDDRMGFASFLLQSAFMDFLNANRENSVSQNRPPCSWTHFWTGFRTGERSRSLCRSTTW